MIADTQLLMGEIIESPEGETKDIEGLLSGFLTALVKEVYSVTEEGERK